MQPAPGGVAPGDFGGGGLGAPQSAAPGRYARDEPDNPGRYLPGDAADTPVSGFHALLRQPADPRAAAAAPPVTPPREGLIPPAEWAPRAPRTTSPTGGRTAPPGEWHFPAGPAAPGAPGPSGTLSSDPVFNSTVPSGTVPGGTGSGGTGADGTGAGANAANGAGASTRAATDTAAHGPGSAGTGNTMTEARAGDGDDDGPDTAVGLTLPPDPLTGTGYHRPSRTRLLAGAAAVAILGVTGVTGTLVVMHSHQTAASVPVTTSAATGGASTQRRRGGDIGPPGRAGGPVELAGAGRPANPPGQQRRDHRPVLPEKHRVLRHGQRRHRIVPPVRRDLASG